MRVNALALIQSESRSVMILQEVDKALIGDLSLVQSAMRRLNVSAGHGDGCQLLLGQRLALRLRQHPGRVPQLLVHAQLGLVKDCWLYDGLLEPGEQLPVLLHLGGGGHEVGGADGVYWLV